MKTITEHLRDRLFVDTGFSKPPVTAPSLDELYRTQWCHEFERLMRNRLVMGSSGMEIS